MAPPPATSSRCTMSLWARLVEKLRPTRGGNRITIVLDVATGSELLRVSRQTTSHLSDDGETLITSAELGADDRLARINVWDVSRAHAWKWTLLACLVAAGVSTSVRPYGSRFDG